MVVMGDRGDCYARKEGKVQPTVDGTKAIMIEIEW